MVRARIMGNKRANQCFTFGQNAKIIIDSSYRQGYCHIRSDRTGYFLTLCSTCIAISEHSNRAKSSTKIHVMMNMNSKRLERTLSDKNDNHRSSLCESFCIEKHLGRIVAQNSLNVTIASSLLILKRMSEPLPLIMNAPEQVSLIANGQPTHQYQLYFLEFPCAQKYWRFMQDKYGLETHWDNLDWKSFHKAMRSYGSNGPTLWKILHGWLSTADANQCHGAHKQLHCPFCDLPETTAHLFLCKQHEWCIEISQAMDNFYHSLSEIMHPEIVDAIQDQISNWNFYK